MSDIKIMKADRITIATCIDPDTKQAQIMVSVSEGGEDKVFIAHKTPVQMTNTATALMKTALEKAQMDVAA